MPLLLTVFESQTQILHPLRPLIHSQNAHCNQMGHIEARRLEHHLDHAWEWQEFSFLSHHLLSTGSPQKQEAESKVEDLGA